MGTGKKKQERRCGKGEVRKDSKELESRCVWEGNEGKETREGRKRERSGRLESRKGESVRQQGN